jgi:hypothetical protein
MKAMRETAPQGDFTGSEVALGFLILIIGFCISIVLPVLFTCTEDLCGLLTPKVPTIMWSPGTLLSILSVLIALIAASPLIIQFTVYALLGNQIKYQLRYPQSQGDEIEWWRLSQDELSERIDDVDTIPALSINSTGGAPDIHIEKIEMILDLDNSWNIRSSLDDDVHQISSGRYRVSPVLFTLDSGTKIGDPGFLPSGKHIGATFPLEPEASEGKMMIQINYSISAEEVVIPVLGPLPRFYGDIRLKPIKESYWIKR